MNKGKAFSTKGVNQKSGDRGYEVAVVETHLRDLSAGDAVRATGWSCLSKQINCENTHNLKSRPADSSSSTSTSSSWKLRYSTGRRSSSSFSL